ncbi:MAG: K(+)-transporting ATPase subunit F [Elusimicrobia bacterium]|nr:K(+)-transporting ATPase subunit F [Elusimicrobiota bacterium]
MTPVYWTALTLSAGLSVYLLVALFKPELF